MTYKNSILASAGVLIIALAGLNHVSAPDATASQFLSGRDVLAAGPALAALTLTAPAPKAAGVNLDAANRDSIADLARNDPWELARLGHELYEKQIRDYTCVFVKQERIDGKLRDPEEIEVRYRDDPKTVYMIWKRNARQAKRVLFKDAPDFVNDKGEKLARVEPAGALIRLIVSDIFMPIHGKRARESSRRSIDDFGFRATFDLLDHYNQLGLDRGVLDLRYDGEGQIDGRPTFRFVRQLPYKGPDGIWPDARMVLHLDQQWLLPTAVYSYADREGKLLLGSYVHTRVKLNPGLADDAFRF